MTYQGIMILVDFDLNQTVAFDMTQQGIMIMADIDLNQTVA